MKIRMTETVFAKLQRKVKKQIQPPLFLPFLITRNTIPVFQGGNTAIQCTGDHCRRTAAPSPRKIIRTRDPAGQQQTSGIVFRLRFRKKTVPDPVQQPVFRLKFDKTAVSGGILRAEYGTHPVAL